MLLGGFAELFARLYGFLIDILFIIQLSLLDFSPLPSAFWPLSLKFFSISRNYSGRMCRGAKAETLHVLESLVYFTLKGNS